jgi:glycosyltransferase
MALRVSIITATYNSATTVADTLHSISSQGYPDIEHIIIDGKSKDNTLEIVSEFAHVSSIISEEDKGIYDAMNKGIGIAKGDIVGILNSDDIYAHPDVVANVVKVFEQTDCDAVYGDLVYVYQADTNRVIRLWRAGVYKQNAFKWGWMPPHPTFFVRKEIYDRHGVFSLDLKTAADYELMLRFIHRFGIRLQYLPEILVKMRAGGASNASFSRRWRANQADREAWIKNGLSPYWFTLYMKPLRKMGQFLFKSA